jgi:four helix bundle protein
MATFTRFEDIEAWQSARTIARDVYRVTNEGAFVRDFGLRDQIRRAAVSVMANIAEGFGRGGNREFAQFLGTARGSAAELRSHLYVAIDAGLIAEPVAAEIMAKANRVEGQLTGLITYLSKSDMRGSRLRPQNLERRT